jgi:site-specific DNA-methyltransferase (adenine-specific)
MTEVVGSKERISTMLQTAIVLNRHLVYRSEELKKRVLDLENRYQVKDEVAIFNQLVNFSKNVNVPYHGWFKYREGYSHILIRHLLERYRVPRDEIVVDPFCGSGTTIVEAALQGYSAFGMDVNPLSAFITNVKATAYTEADIAEAEAIWQTFGPDTGSLSHVDGRYGDVRAFFSGENFTRLLSIKRFVDGIPSPKLRRLFQLGLLSIVEEVSDRKRDGNGLVTRPSKVRDVAGHFCNKMRSIFDDIRAVRIGSHVSAFVASGDAANLSNVYAQHVNGKVGAIMFSPPYANSFDYFESYKMELVLGDFVDAIGEIKRIREHAVRSFVGASDKPVRDNLLVDQLAAEIEQAIPEKEQLTGKRDSRTRKVPAMIRGYFNDMGQIIEQCAKLLEAGRKCFIVVDQSAYLGILVPSDLILGMLAEQHGLAVKEVIVCRKARTSPQQLKRFPYLNDILRESIVVLEKR